VTVPTDAPRVTIAIPTYRRPEFLRQSLASAVQQTVAEIEIVVSDNGNDEETAAVVASFGDERVQYSPLSENVGMAGNMTRCLGLGTAPYVAILQDDDVLMPESIERKLRRFERDPTLAVVHTAHAVINHAGELLRPEVNWSLATEDWELDGATFIRRSISSGVFFHISTALLRRAAVADEVFEPGSGYNDLAVWLRIASRGARFAYIHEPLSAIREHGSSESALQGLHARDEGALLGAEVNTETFEQTRQMQEVRRAFLDREGRQLPDRQRLWKAARRDARKRLARVIVKDALAQGSLRRTRERVREASSIEPGIRFSIWSLVAYVIALGGVRAWRVVSVLAAPLGRLWR
jgi:glycosyltransferase involved in cell wall biosynthesis